MGHTIVNELTQHNAINGEKWQVKKWCTATLKDSLGPRPKSLPNKPGSCLNCQDPRVVAVTRSRLHRLQTTRSWDFVGLNLPPPPFPAPTLSPVLLENAKYGDGVVIGVVDTWIWPELSSFSDEGLGPLPPQWRGKCDEGFNCSRKIIGTRWFVDGFRSEYNLTANEFLSLRDASGHGTHVASIAAG